MQNTSQNPFSNVDNSTLNQNFVADCVVDDGQINMMGVDGFDSILGLSLDIFDIYIDTETLFGSNDLDLLIPVDDAMIVSVDCMPGVLNPVLNNLTLFSEDALNVL